MENIELVFGSDHAGFALKEKLRTFVLDNIDNVVAVIDGGCTSNERVDYPDYAKKVAHIMKTDYPNRFGVLVCGTGIGIGIVANRFDHIRCALCTDTYSAEMARKHNNANCISLGSRRTNFEEACEILKTFLETEFEGGRHQKRLDKINHLKTMLAD